MVELLLAVLLTGVLGFFVADFMKSQSQGEALIRAKADISKTIGMVETALRNKSVCKAIFAGKTPPATGVSNVSLSYTTPSGATKVLLADNRDYGIWKTDTIHFGRSGISPNILDITVRYIIKASNQRGDRKIPIVVSTNTAGAIQDCGPLLADSNTAAKKEFCESLPGVATWNGTDCVLNNNLRCPNGQVVERMTSLGGLICVPALNRVDPNNLFETTPLDCTNKPNIRLESTNGKIKAVCDGSGCTPVNGVWAAWANWSNWAGCVGGFDTRSRNRFCNSPAPSCGGTTCPGCVGAACPTSSYDEESVACGVVNGNWSDWSPAGACNVGTNEMALTRTCTNPAPSGGGAPCPGVDTMTRVCTCGENLTADASKLGGEWHCCSTGWFPTTNPVYFAHTDCTRNYTPYHPDGNADSWYCVANPGYSGTGSVSSQCMTKF